MSANSICPMPDAAQVLVASEGEVAEEDEGEVDDVGAAKRAVRRTQGSLASMSGAGGLVRFLQRFMFAALT